MKALGCQLLPELELVILIEVLFTVTDVFHVHVLDEVVICAVFERFHYQKFIRDRAFLEKLEEQELASVGLAREL